MSRPKCCRHIGALPGKTFFQPEGAAPSSFEAVLLTLDEYEAIRLADLDGLYQEQAASRMSVSRQTFGRIVEAAHRKIADVIVNGKALRIEGGPVSLAGAESVRCPRCSRALGLAYGEGNEPSCPHCSKQAENRITLKRRTS
ncbi:MAG: DUF134 domain-containing protein [Proteobacteria bacterium]|nr:DUF134 domain-containing protein [Pseudomonadota bacterium]